MLSLVFFKKKRIKIYFPFDPIVLFLFIYPQIGKKKYALFKMAKFCSGASFSGVLHRCKKDGKSL